MQLKKKKSESFLQFRDRVWKTYYHGWRNKPVYCPALKKKVWFTDEGWEHVVGIGKSRPRVEIYKRIKLLRYTRSIISRSKTIQSVKILRGDIYYGFISVEELRKFLLGGRKIKRVKIVIKQKKTGKPIFYSIME